MRLGFYYSQSQDWHEQDGAGNTWDFGPDQGADGKELKNYDAYLRGKAEPQVRELLTGYGPVALIWFDTPRMMTAERGQRFADIVRSTAAQHADRRAARHRRGLPVDRRQRHSPGGVHRGVGDAGDDQRHVGLSQGRHQLEVAGADHLQARRHRQQGRQLPAECRPDCRRHHSAGEPGRPANGRPLAEGERRRGVWRRRVTLRRRVRRVHSARREGRARTAACSCRRRNGE